MPLPNLVTRNQYGEVQNQFIKSGSSYSMWCNFVVDSTNGNGLGISSLKSSGPSSASEIANVYMHTSATPATGNPNPAVGLILVEFRKAFASYINGTYGIASPASGSNINVTAGLTAGNVYIITSLGTTSLANWQTLGWLGTALPTVGASFIAITSSAGTGTGTVQAPAAAGSTVGSIEVVGDPNQTVIASTANLICGVFSPTNSSTTTPVLTAPANNSVIGLTFNLIKAAGPLI